MGGVGSGSWYRLQGKKATVEESLVVEMADVRRRLFAGASGRLTWTWAGGHQASIGYAVTWGEGPIVTLHYRWQDCEDVRIPVRLQSTPTQFNGHRWWFTCPLTVDGIACQRRVGKLYLPTAGRLFGCRKCHDLTYRSCQEAHHQTRMITGIEGLRRWLDSHSRMSAGG